MPLPGGALVTRGHDGVLRVEGPAPEGLAAGLAGGPRASSLGATPDGRTLVVGDAEGGLRLFGTGGPREPVAAVGGRRVPVTAVTALPTDEDGVLVAAGLADGSVTLWAPPRQPLEGALSRRGSFPVAVAARRTAAGPLVAVAWSDRVVTVRHLGTGATRAAPLHDVLGLALSPDTILIAAGYDGVTAWDVDLAAPA